MIKSKVTKYRRLRTNILQTLTHGTENVVPNPLRVKIEPVYRGRNRLSYEYKGFLLEYDQTSKVYVELYTVTKRLRRDVHLLVYQEKSKWEAIRRSQFAHPLLKLNSSAEARAEREATLLNTLPLGSGMNGRQHTPEARRAIGEAVRRRWAEGAYRGAKVGRPTNAEHDERVAASEKFATEQLAALELKRKAARRDS